MKKMKMMRVAPATLGDSWPSVGVPGEGTPWPGTAQRGPGRAGSRTPGVRTLMHQDSLQIPARRGKVPAAVEPALSGGREGRAAITG